jgi:hypothetical protein
MIALSRGGNHLRSAFPRNGVDWILMLGSSGLSILSISQPVAHELEPARLNAPRLPGETVEQIVHGDRQAARELDQRVDPRDPLAPLKLPHGGAVKRRQDAQLFLGKTGALASTPKVVSEALFEGAVGHEATHDMPPSNSSKRRAALLGAIRRDQAVAAQFTHSAFYRVLAGLPIRFDPKRKLKDRQLRRMEDKDLSEDRALHDLVLLSRRE